MWWVRWGWGGRVTFVSGMERGNARRDGKPRSTEFPLLILAIVTLCFWILEPTVLRAVLGLETC